MKKQLIILAMFTIVASTFILSCKSGKKQIYDKTVFDSIQVNETTHLFNDTAAPGNNLAIKIVYPVRSESQTLTDSVDAALIAYSFGPGYQGLDLKAAVDSFRATYAREYLTDVEPLYNEDRKNNPDEKEWPWFNYYSTIDAAPVDIPSDYLVYKLENSSYTGGAHGMYNTTYLNFIPGSGKIVRLKTLFKPGYEKQLNEMLLSKLMKDTGSSTLEELQEKAYLQDTEMYPSENFCVGNDSITFIYNVYEIAPYSSGITEITLPLDKLGEIMNK